MQDLEVRLLLEAIYDQAELFVNGTQIFVNPLFSKTSGESPISLRPYWPPKWNFASPI